MRNKNLFNRKSLKLFRSSLRNNSTSAEAMLWDMLKSKNINGRKFRRQHSIGNYIVDFCCTSEKLVIELDGNPHCEYYKIEEDKKEIYILKALDSQSLGINRLVFQEPEYVKNEIRKIFKMEDPEFK